MNSEIEKLSYEELIKALECCAHTIENNMCGECPAAKYKAGTCDDLVKLQAAEMLKDLKAENAKLKAKCEDCAGCTQWNCDCANERAEALREVADRLDRKFAFCSDTQCISAKTIRKFIQDELKEMVGEQNAETIV